MINGNESPPVPPPTEPHFSDKVQPLIKRLSSKADTFPTDTDEILKEYGKDTAVQLVAELIDQKATLGYFFADACALVRIDELPATAREWFQKQGLLVLDNENIKVHLRHKEDFTNAMVGCHEVGEAILHGSPGPYEIDFERKPTHVARSRVFANDAVERFPRGAWAEVNIWNTENPRLQFTVTNAYIGGTGPNARGILVPAGTAPIAYVHTKNSYKSGAEERNFYIKQGDMHPNAWYGLYALGLYLKGEIPAV